MNCEEVRKYIAENGHMVLAMVSRGESPPHQLEEVLLHLEACREPECIDVEATFTTMLGDAKSHILVLPLV